MLLVAKNFTMKIYLDTNIILDWFKRMMQKERNDREFVIPKVIEFLISMKEFELTLSNLTKIEIIRYLISEWNCDIKFAEKHGMTLCSHSTLLT